MVGGTKDGRSDWRFEDMVGGGRFGGWEFEGMVGKGMVGKEYFAFQTADNTYFLQCQIVET